MVSLKDNLQLILKKKGWTSARLARETGLPKSTIHALTSIGQSSVNLGHLKKIATRLEVSMHELCYGEPDPFEINGSEILKEIFTGDIRVSIHRIERLHSSK
jgi:transcriptional regulator with XRE-family HTH domain